MRMDRKLILSGVFFVLFLILSARHSYAASLSNAKDTITTSRPSASAPLDANQAASDGQLTIKDNGSFYLASDSAILQADTGQTLNSVVVASMSAANTPAANQRVVYLGSTPANTHHNGTAVIVPITAMHTISFTTATAIPIGGKIILTFPGTTGVNTSSPSASTFSFNGMVNGTSSISYKIHASGTATCTTLVVSAPSITCTTTGAIVPAGTAVTFLIGCADANTNTATCTTQAQRLINPTKSAAAGVADIWKVAITTQDSGSVTLDSSTIAIGTIESVTVRATVDPSLTFTITGLNNGDAANLSNAGCSYADTMNSGLNSTSTEVNLGVLSNTPAVNTLLRNVAGQRIDITTNGSNGYVLTATSSGHLVNPETGYFLNDSNGGTPLSFPASDDFFGLHACGDDAPTNYTESGGGGGIDCDAQPSGSGGVTECRYAWPTATTAITVASDATGPIGIGAGSNGDGVTSISYAAGVDAGVPPGQYRSIITYVATPAF